MTFYYPCSSGGGTMDQYGDPFGGLPAENEYQLPDLGGLDYTGMVPPINTGRPGPQMYYGSSPAIPGVRPGDWKSACDRANVSLGVFDNDNRPKVGIIGAGLAGAIAALELARAGGIVHVYDVKRGPGGKLRIPQIFDEEALGEYALGNGLPQNMAAIRFGEGSEDIRHLAEEYGFYFTEEPNMPNAGVVPTLLFHPETDEPMIWDPSQNIVPEFIKRPLAATEAMLNEQIFISGEPIISCSLNELRLKLGTPLEPNDPAYMQKVVANLEDCQRLYNFSKGKTIAQVHEILFGSDNSTPPGGLHLDDNEIIIMSDCYATGSHHTYRDITAFWTDIAWFLTGSSTRQYVMMKEGSFASLQELVQAIVEIAEAHGATFHYNADVLKIVNDPCEITISDEQGIRTVQFDAVLNTSSPASSKKMGMADPEGGQPEYVKEAMRNDWPTPTSKFSRRISAQYWRDDPSLPRNIQFRTNWGVLYIIWDGVSDVARAHFYLWNKDALTIQQIGSPESIWQAFVQMAYRRLQGYPRLRKIVEALQTCPEGSIIYKHWQQDDKAGGGWTFLPAGSEHHSTAYVKALMKKSDSKESDSDSEESDSDSEENGLRVYEIGSTKGPEGGAWFKCALLMSLLGVHRIFVDFGAHINFSQLAPLKYLKYMIQT